MPNAIEIAKAATTAYNDKNWDKLKALFAENGVYDEKGSGRRIQGAALVIEAWQGWAKAIPDSKATFVAEYASGDTAILEVVWKGKHTGPLQMPAGAIPASTWSILSSPWMTAWPPGIGASSCSVPRPWNVGRRKAAP